MKIQKQYRVDWITAILPVLLFYGCNPADARVEVPTPDQQIAAAITPLPEDKREQATVLGYNEEADLVTLREGEGFICLADDPRNQEEFHVACYVESLEPFMERGRALRAEGMSSEEVRDTRRQEILDGKLYMPEGPTALYSLTGPVDGYDFENGELRRARELYVVYIPFATGEETGLPTTPVGDGIPWLMNEGEPWAHIMYSSGREVGADTEN